MEKRQINDIIWTVIGLNIYFLFNLRMPEINPENNSRWKPRESQIIRATNLGIDIGRLTGELVAPVEATPAAEAATVAAPEATPDVVPVVPIKVEAVPAAENKEESEEFQRKKRITEDLELVLKPVDRNVDDTTRRENNTLVWKGIRRLESEGLVVNDYLRKDINPGEKNTEDNKILGKRKKILLEIVRRLKEGNTLNDTDLIDGDNGLILTEKGIAEMVNLSEKDVLKNGERVAPRAERQPVPIKEEGERNGAGRADKASWQIEIERIDEIINNPTLQESLRRSWIERHLANSNIPHEVMQTELGKIENKQGEGRVERREMPTEPEKYRKFIRNVLVDVIQNETNTSRLDFNQIETSIKSLVRERLMGSSPSEGNSGSFELYPEALGDRLTELKELIKKEIEARANLRKLQLNEEKYKQGGGGSLASYLREMGGTDENLASPLNISMDTYQWLINLDSLGDPDLTTEKVDKALMVLLKLGERNPDFSDPEMEIFRQFRTGSKNIYDPNYGEDNKKRALDTIANHYGKDAFNIAYQIFQAYKEEGNYNPDHYLNILFQFAQARKGLYAGGSPAGSIRVYSEQTTDGGYETQIPFLALSPLRAQQIRQTMDPVSGEPKDVKEPFFLYNRALQGLFLRSFTPSTIKNTPEKEAFATVKEANKVRLAIVEGIGKLGTLANKGDQIPEAVKHLITLRNSGQELVDKKVFTQEEWDKQMLIEAKNAIWELSINYPTNKDLGNQSLAKPFFLLPSKLNELFVRLGDLTGKKELRIIQNGSDYLKLRSYVIKMVETTYNRIKEPGVVGGKIPWHKGDDEILKSEKYYAEKAKLPDTLGGSVSYPSGFFAMFR